MKKESSMRTVIYEWAGCITGIAGALLLALHSQWSGWGFVFYLTSNAFWIAFGVKKNVRGLIAMQLAFTATSMLGVWKWLIAPHS